MTSSEDEVLLDGSIGEGGGQILRTAVAAAALLGKRIRIYNIRAKRRPPGLRPQHLTAVKAVAALTGAKVEGLSVGSTEIYFEPHEPRSGHFSFDAGTAGSTTLMLQSLMPVMCFAPGEVWVELRGGTNNPLAPPVEYLTEVLMPVLRRMGVSAEVELVKRGFYPKGMGVVRASTKPTSKLSPIVVERASIREIEILAYSCNLPDHITKRMVEKAERMLKDEGYEVTKRVEVLQRGDSKCSVDPGTGIILIARLSNGLSLGVDALGEKGLPAEKVAENAVIELVKQLRSGAPVDKHLGDQLVIWVALADGTSKYMVSELTSHASTSIEIARRIIGAYFEIEQSKEGAAWITCRGIGLSKAF